MANLSLPRPLWCLILEVFLSPDLVSLSILACLSLRNLQGCLRPITSKYEICLMVVVMLRPLTQHCFLGGTQLLLANVDNYIYWWMVDLVSRVPIFQFGEFSLFQIFACKICPDLLFSYFCLCSTLFSPGMMFSCWQVHFITDVSSSGCIGSFHSQWNTLLFLQ